MTRFIPLTAAAVFIGGAMAASAADFREIDADASMKLASYDKTGGKKSCVSTKQIKSMTFVEDQLIVILLADGKKYLNQTSNACGKASRPNHHFEYRMPTTQLCKGEIIRVYESTGDILTGTCSLGDFEEVSVNGEA